MARGSWRPRFVPGGEQLTRTPWCLLLGWLTAGMVLRWDKVGGSWLYFETGSNILFSPDCSRLYATHSELRIGRLGLVAAAPFTL
jgi:hypothetical protein